MNAKSVSHFTIDGHPLCTCMAPAYHDRLTAAGSPPCEDDAVKQTARYHALLRAFPGRVALLRCPCPVMAAQDARTTVRHTREPWHVNALRIPHGAAHVMSRGYVVATCDGPGGIGKDDAARIVQCVNACDGVTDPAKAVDALRALLYAEDSLQHVLDLANAAGISR